MTTCLVLDDNTTASIQKVVAFAQQHKMSKAVLEKILAGKAKPAGDNPGYACEIPVGYKVVFTIEEQPFGWCRHISISIAEKYPHPIAVETLMKEFGFKKGIKESDAQYLEEEVRAVNILEKI